MFLLYKKRSWYQVQGDIKRAVEVTAQALPVNVNVCIVKNNMQDLNASFS